MFLLPQFFTDDVGGCGYFHLDASTGGKKEKLDWKGWRGFRKWKRKMGRMRQLDSVTRFFIHLGGAAPVWPDLAKFHHFGKYFKKIGNLFKVYLFLGNVFSSLWHNLYAFGQIFIAVNGQILITQSGYLFTLQMDILLLIQITFQSDFLQKKSLKSCNFFIRRVAPTHCI